MKFPPEHYDVDAGDDHYLRFTQWSPDRALNPQYDGIPDVEKWGATVWHLKPSGEPCMSAIDFDGPVQRQMGTKVMWTVESWEPLTLSPSLLCTAEGCGDHGFIRQGRWVIA